MDRPEYEHATFNTLPVGPGMNSISWRRDKFELLSKPQAERASASRLHVSPARFVTWVRLRHIDSHVRIAVVNCHLISKPDSDSWRAAQWTNNMRVLGQVIARLRSDGYVVLVGGDFNKAEPDLIPGLFEPPTAFLTVDRIGVPADAKATARLGPQAGSDHFPIIAKLTLKETL